MNDDLLNTVDPRLSERRLTATSLIPTLQLINMSTIEKRNRKAFNIEKTTVTGIKKRRFGILYPGWIIQADRREGRL